MGYIILPAKELEELQNIDIRPGQVVMFGDSLSDGNITMKGLGGSIKDLTEIGGTEGTIRYNEEKDKIEIQRAGEWHGSDSTGGGSIKYGTNSQIPYMNAGGTEFDYIQNLRTAITPSEVIGREVVKLHVDSWGIKTDTLTVANSSDTTKYYTKIGNSGNISGSTNNLVWTIHNNGENTTFRTNNLSPLKLGTNNTDRLIIAGDGTINIGTLGTGTASKLLAVDASGNLVDGSSLAGSGGGLTINDSVLWNTEGIATYQMGNSNEVTLYVENHYPAATSYAAVFKNKENGQAYPNIGVKVEVDAESYDATGIHVIASSTGANAYALRLEDGNQLDGRFLGTDANGNATWKDLPSNSGGGSSIAYGTSTQIPIMNSANTGFIYAPSFRATPNSTGSSTDVTILNNGGNHVGLTVKDPHGQYTKIYTNGIVGTTDYTIANQDTAYLGWKIGRLSNSGIFFGSTDGDKSLFLSTKDNNDGNARVFEMTSTGDVMLGKRYSDNDEAASLAIFNSSNDGSSSVLNLFANTGTSTTPSYASIIDFKNDGTINIPSTSIKTGTATTLLAVDASGNLVDGSALAGSGGGGGSSVWTESTNAATYDGNSSLETNIKLVNSSTGTGVNDGLHIGIASSNVHFINKESGSIDFRTRPSSSDIDRLKIHNDGTVQVVRNSGGLVIGDDSNTTPATMGVYGTSGNAHFSSSAYGYSTSNGMFVGIGTGPDAHGYAWVKEDLPFIIKTKNTERLRVKGDGDVGIGFPDLNDGTAITSRLHVRGEGNDSSTASFKVETLDASSYFTLRDDKKLIYNDGGSLTAGDILTLNADGTATWQTPSGGGGGSGFTIDAVDGQIPFVDSTNTAYEYSNNFKFSGKTLTIIGSNTNDDLIRTYTDGQVTTEVFGVKSRGDVSGAINGKGWKITRFATSSTLFGATTNNPLSLGAGTELASSNKTGGHMHINPNGNITIGDDTFNSLAVANGFDKGARLYIKSGLDDDNLHLVSNVDVSLFKVSNDGTINIPSTSIKSDTPITLLAVDASGNLVDGSALAGGGGSSVAYGDAGNIPFVNSTGDGFSYTNNEVATTYPGKLTFDSGTLTVRGLIPTDPNSYESRKALTTLSVVKSHSTNQVKQSLTVRGDGTVFIGESRIVNGSALSGNLYQNVLAFHEMSAAAVSEIENQTYVHKLYVEYDATTGGRLWFKNSTGTTSLLNAWTLVKDTGSTIERTVLTGYTKSIIELRSGATSGSNTFGTASQGMTLVAAQGAKIGTNGTSLTDNVFSSSIVVSSGSANFGTHGDINNSVLVGSSATIESGSHNFVFGGSSRIYSSPSGNDDNFIAGRDNDLKGFKNIIIGSGGWLRPDNLYVNNRFSNPVPDHIKYSSLIGHGLLATRDHQTLIGSGFSATYVPVPLVALTPHKTNNSNNQAHFAIYHPVDSTGNPTSDFQAHNMVFGHRAVRAETSNSLGAYPISQYAGQNIFQLVHGYNKSTLREPTGKINYTFSMWPISVTQEDTNTLVGKTGLKMKTSGTVNTGNLTNDARYHFLGESAIFNGGAHAERHVDADVSVIAIGRGNDKNTSSIQSKNSVNEVTFDVRDDGVVVYKSITFGNLPAAADSTGGQLFLTTGGTETNVMIYSDGTNWRSMISGNPIYIQGGA